MTDKQFDLLNWRIDQLLRMVIDLAERVGQHDFAEEITRFHNQAIVPAVDKIIALDRESPK